MEKTGISVGVSVFSLNEILIKFCREEGFPIKGEKGEQKIRCLVIDYSGNLTVIFNIDWTWWIKDFTLAVKKAVEAEIGKYPNNILFFATHTHTGIDAPKPIRDYKKNKDHWLVVQMIQSMIELFRQAYANRKPALIKVGSGIVDSISANSDEMDGDYEKNVYVLRIDDTNGDMICALANFPCHPTLSRSAYYISGDFPTAMETTVQKVYGDIPVFYINGAAGDMHPVHQRVSPDFDNIPIDIYRQEKEKVDWAEVERIGRILGLEVCKVLAELEVAGQKMVVGNCRWNYTEWEKHLPGILIAEPTFIIKSQKVMLTKELELTKDECDQKIESIKQKIKQIQKEHPLPYEPRIYAPYLLRREDLGSPLFDLMSLNAELYYWKNKRGGISKNENCVSSIANLCVIGISREVGIVCFAGEMFHETAEAIRQQSPFKITMIFGYMATPGETTNGLYYLTTESKVALGSYHSYNQPEFEQEVACMAVKLLSDVSEEIQKTYEQI